MISSMAETEALIATYDDKVPVKELKS